MSGYEEYFKNTQNCFNDLIIARENWNFSRESDNQINKTLKLMHLYCDKKIKAIVLAAIDELEYRIKLIEKHDPTY